MERTARRRVGWLIVAALSFCGCKRESAVEKPARVATTAAPRASPPPSSAPLADDEVDEWTPKRVVLTDVLSWPRATSRQFGCMLERAGHKDASFHCAAKKPPAGDPCTDVTAYSRGPEFPDALVAIALSGARRIHLTWEHGELQGVDVDFAPGFDDAAIRKALDLPRSKEQHKNVMDADVQHCSKDGWCLLLEGFEHMGAGDVDCGATDDEETPE